MKKVLLLILLSNLIFAKELKSIKEEYESILSKKYALLPHNGIFLLPFSYSNNPNKKSYEAITSRSEFADRGEFNREVEAEFQVSFLILLARNAFGSDYQLFLGYTQNSWWQVYNAEWSRQFRETNYGPEVFARRILSKPIKFLGGDLIGYDLGFIHQSNGQIQELSRSWNRVYARFLLNYKNTFVKADLWYRVPDSIDENPDTKEFIGHGQIEIAHIWKKNKYTVKFLPGIHKAGVELSYSYPLKEGLRFFTKINYGYGHALIDYDHRTEKVGLGVELTDLLTSKR